MYELDFLLEVHDWLTQYADHEPDWADACLAILSGRHKNLKVWTYEEFSLEWLAPRGAKRHEAKPNPASSTRSQSSRQLVSTFVSGALTSGALRSQSTQEKTYPYLKREDILQALRYAAWLAEEREVTLPRA